MLILCLLLSQISVPVGVYAAENSQSYSDTTLGGYYKFTFSEEETYNYTFGERVTYKNNTFMPLHAQSAVGANVGYKQVTDSVTGEKYDTLEIVNGSNFNFTPVTKDGQPFELTPGNEYTVKINVFNPVSNAWTHAFLCVGQDNPDWGKFIEIKDSVYNYTSYPYNVSSSFSNQGGMAWHYIIKDDTYGKTSVFTDYNSGVCLHTSDESYGLNCTHAKRTSGSPYLQKERTISLPYDYFEYDEENKSYSATNTVYTKNGSEYVATGNTLDVNNYLTFYFGGGNVSTYAKSNYPLYGNAEYSDLFDQSGTAKANYTVWQIESIEIWEKVMGRVNYHIGDSVTALSGEPGTEVDLNPSCLPDSKFLISWYTDEQLSNPLTYVPTFKEDEVTDLYAKLGTYTGDVTYNLKGATQPTLKPYEYMENGEIKCVTLNESGWAYKEYTDEGVALGKSDGGNAYKWNPSNTSKLTQTTSSQDYVALTADAEVGARLNGGWSAFSNYVIRDENGNPAVAKPNTNYAIAITYKRLTQGKQNIVLAAGRKAAYVSTGANDTSSNSYNRFNSSPLELDIEEITDEYMTHTFYVKVGDFSEGDIPVFSIHNGASGYVVERVADVNGIKSYEVNGQTYYPYKIISYPQIVIKDVQFVEIDSGNVAVTYNYYEKGKGFSAVLADAAPGTALLPTETIDANWYDTKEACGNRYTVFPYVNASLYTADYYISQGRDLHPDTPTIGDKDTISSVRITRDGEEIPALKYTSNKKVTLNDAQVLRIGSLEDGHTYRFTAQIKADSLKTDMQLVFASADKNNALHGRNVAAYQNIAAGSVKDGEWKTVTCYFTADPNGIVADKEQHGFDYKFLQSYNALFLCFVQEGTGQNTVYLSDINVEDLGKVITTGGASVLTDGAAQSAGHQALRYYFSYNSVNGKDITIGGEDFTVVERGFIYKNGSLSMGATEVSGFFATNERVLKASKNTDLNDCWAYADGTITFSTYVKDLDIADDTRKIQVKGYLLIEAADGSRYYIYSDSINRSVDGIKNGDPNERRLIWTEEFNVDSISQIDTFTQKYDTMTSSDSNLVTSTSEENYFVDSDTGELVLRVTSDGNRNYKTPKSVTTRDIMSFRYGYLEMRAKVPYQTCVWPSFWLQPDKSAWNKTTYTGEIDIFEVFGSKTGLSCNLHKWYTNSEGKSVSTTIGSNGNYLYGERKYTFDSTALANDYHTYGFEWTPEFMAFYIDGELYCKIDITEETGEYNPAVPGMDCFHNYYYVCLNNWLFTEQNSWSGTYVENVEDFGTVDYRIDYIRLYQNLSEDVYLY